MAAAAADSCSSTSEVVVRSQPVRSCWCWCCEGEQERDNGSGETELWCKGERANEETGDARADDVDDDEEEEDDDDDEEDDDDDDDKSN